MMARVGKNQWVMLFVALIADKVLSAANDARQLRCWANCSLRRIGIDKAR